MISLICGLYKNDANEHIYKTETDSRTEQTKLWLPRGKGGGGKSQEVEINTCTPL